MLLVQALGGGDAGMQAADDVVLLLVQLVARMGFARGVAVLTVEDRSF
jgi:hypothetical protein